MTGIDDRLDLSDAPGSAGRAEQWETLLSATHLPWTVTIPPDRNRTFDAHVRRWWIDDLALVDCECDPCSGTRQRRQIADTDGDFFVVLITRSGRETVTQHDVSIDLAPGDAVAWDSSTPAKFTVWERLSKRSLVVPRSALDEVGGKTWARSGVTLRGDSPATQLLTDYLDSLARSLSGLSRSAVAAARNATLELLIGAIRPDTDDAALPGSGPALREAIDRFIEQNLLDGGLGPGVIAAAHGVSVRTVNRAYTASGHTVSETIRLRRLARARGELTESTTSIGAIAGKWGFADGSHFSRTFKTAYGTTPRDFRDAHRSRTGALVPQVVREVHADSDVAIETGVTPARR
ncbi:MAG: helix-turn-helix domain-containing protein [Rhodococcus sp. (in: high G+C Gram-positive bacteria)]